MLAVRPQEGGQSEDTRIEDPEQARAMAIASNRNELNRVAFKAIALEHMKNPDLRESPLRAHTSQVEGKTYSSVDPSVRIVEAKMGGYGLTHTADSAIAEAQKERAEADEQARLAADRYDALNKL